MNNGAGNEKKSPQYKENSMNVLVILTPLIPSKRKNVFVVTMVKGCLPLYMSERAKERQGTITKVGLVETLRPLSSHGQTHFVYNYINTSLTSNYAHFMMFSLSLGVNIVHYNFYNAVKF